MLHRASDLDEFVLTTKGNKMDMPIAHRIWTGFFWLKIRTSGGLL
jgi:hypothetical protein